LYKWSVLGFQERELSMWILGRK
jgi:hypothetical protein